MGRVWYIYMQKTLKISFSQAKKICFPREQSRAIMTVLLQIKYIMYVVQFSPIFMVSVTLCLLFIKKVHGWQGYF